MNGARGFGAGSALLVLIFSVLCLTATALSVLYSASGDKALAERVGNEVQAYYRADCRAVETSVALGNAIKSSSVPESICGVAIAEQNGVYSFVVTISEKRALSVKVSPCDNSLYIISWSDTYINAWSPDRTLKVWAGEESP